jgi:hypothetical protein
VYILLAIIALLIFAHLTKKVPIVTCQSPIAPKCTSKNTVGDGFTSGCAIAAGVPEPTPPVMPGPMPVFHCCHISGVHYHFPVDPIIPPTPIPIKITTPRPVASVPRPMPVRPTPVAWCGNGPGWCTAKLDQLANSPGCRNIGSGCGTF